MNKDTTRTRTLGAATRDARRPRKEPFLAQIASFVDLFVWLLVLKTFFLPLFIIPTGSMAETLAGAHATHTCPNCGYEYMIGPRHFIDRDGTQRDRIPAIIQCPNCRQQEYTTRSSPLGVPLDLKAGDRIVVHGWPFEIGGRFGPRRWDVVVFKNPNSPDINYIKRLIGLPGETIEIIDGDVFVKGKQEESLRPARKTPHAQRALWFPYYNHDYPPAQATKDQRGHLYYPRWVAFGDHSGWRALESRAPRFDGADLSRREIQFVTHPSANRPRALIQDVYGYNSARESYNEVTDVRLSAGIRIEDGDGYVELDISKHEDSFYARLYSDGRVTLARRAPSSTQWENWGETRIKLPDHPVRLALGHADYRLAVEVDGHTVLESSPARYGITPAVARHRSHQGDSPTIRIAAERVRASFQHLLIERDVYYTSGNLRDRGASPGTGTQDHPITLKDDAYFMCGDNSPASHDSRAWSESDLGPHLRRAYAEGTYDIGTVPADQMIGRAFLVYWPGFLPLSESFPRAPNILPDFGRVRWIH